MSFFEYMPRRVISLLEPVRADLCRFAQFDSSFCGGRSTRCSFTPTSEIAEGSRPHVKAAIHSDKFYFLGESCFLVLSWDQAEPYFLTTIYNLPVDVQGVRIIPTVEVPVTVPLPNVEWGPVWSH